MRKIILITAIIFLLIQHTNVFAQKNNTKDEILKTLQVWNDAALHRDTISIMKMFDKSEDVQLVGSDSGEIARGPAAIREFMNFLFSQYSFHWEWKSVDVSYNENTAWAFTDGTMTVTDNAGKVIVTPYRFTAIFVKRNDGWKWRLYNGSIPKGEAE